MIHYQLTGYDVPITYMDGDIKFINFFYKIILIQIFFSFSASEVSHNSIFEQKGILIVEDKNYDLDQVTSDAIDVDALDVNRFKQDDKDYLEVIIFNLVTSRENDI